MRSARRVRLFVQTNTGAYLTVLNVGPSANTTVLFPNARQQDARIRGGKPLEIPAPGSGVNIEVRGPTLGRELIKVIASTEPNPLFAPSKLTAVRLPPRLPCAGSSSGSTAMRHCRSLPARSTTRATLRRRSEGQA